MAFLITKKVYSETEDKWFEYEPDIDEVLFVNTFEDAKSKILKTVNELASDIDLAEPIKNYKDNFDEDEEDYENLERLESLLADVLAGTYDDGNYCDLIIEDIDDGDQSVAFVVDSEKVTAIEGTNFLHFNIHKMSDENGSYYFQYKKYNYWSGDIECGFSVICRPVK